MRRQEREALLPKVEASRQIRHDGPTIAPPQVPGRANILLSRRQDESIPWDELKLSSKPRDARGVVASLTCVNVVELFAGAGGMGLGFLMAGEERTPYRMVFSGEAHPIYAETLKRNHDALRQIRQEHDLTPGDHRPTDLRTPEALNEIAARANDYGGTHLLIGGPPCQGFSNANRNSWHGDNPHNGLVRVYLRYVRTLRPMMFLMENVQGILWTPQTGKSSTASVLAHITRRCGAMGYIVFPRLLDAVWYGVPQHRSRLFLFGVRSDLGYRAEDFGSWGPFPLPSHGPGTDRPYTTVRDAIGDLPSVGNGQDDEMLPYRKPDTLTLRRNEFLRLNAILERLTKRSLTTSRRATRTTSSTAIGRFLPAGIGRRSRTRSRITQPSSERTATSIAGSPGTIHRSPSATIERACWFTRISSAGSPFARRRDCSRFLTGSGSQVPRMETAADWFTNNSNWRMPCARS